VPFSELYNQFGTHFISVAYRHHGIVVIEILLIAEAQIAAHEFINVAQSTPDCHTVARGIVSEKFPFVISVTAAVGSHSVESGLDRGAVEYACFYRKTVVGKHIVAVSSLVGLVGVVLVEILALKSETAVGPCHGARERIDAHRVRDKSLGTGGDLYLALIERFKHHDFCGLGDAAAVEGELYYSFAIGLFRRKGGLGADFFVANLERIAGLRLWERYSSAWLRHRARCSLCRR